MKRSLLNEIKKFTYYNNISISNLLSLKIPKGESELKLLQKLVPKNKIAIDIGANIGTYVYGLSKILSASNIYAIEPVVENANIIRKYFPDVHIYNVAMSDSSGDAQIKIPIINETEVTTRGTLENFTDIGETDSKIIEIEKTTLDIFVEKMNILNLGFIKIDVEGHEHKVLEGAQKTISHYKPNLLIEIEQRHHVTDITEIFEIVLRFGYEGYFLSENKVQSIADFSVYKYQNLNKFKTKEYINNFFFQNNSF